MSAELQGRVALVTGASRGIGRGDRRRPRSKRRHSRRLQPRRESTSETVRLIEATGGGADAFVVDLRSPDQAEALIGSVVERFGRLDILVNNAGISRTAGGRSETLEGWNEVLAINLTAPFLLARRAAEHLAAGGRGAIVNVGSVMGLVAMRDLTAYAAAKAGLHHITRQLALDLAPIGIRVNCVAPGFVRTALFETSHTEERKAHIARLHALGVSAAGGGGARRHLPRIRPRLLRHGRLPRRRRRPDSAGGGRRLASRVAPPAPRDFPARRSRDANSFCD
jgi:NAD(P)-dependent dehydrogenase (short-subunit alcohol dehydrogenase family)